MKAEVSMKHTQLLKAIRVCWVWILALVVAPVVVSAQVTDATKAPKAMDDKSQKEAEKAQKTRDSLFSSGRLDSNMFFMDPVLAKVKSERNRANNSVVQSQPYISVQQMLKGAVSGVLSKESTGEPGTEQFMFVRGVPKALLSKVDVYGAQPVVFVNGVPMIQGVGMEYEMQRHDLNPMGPATNLLTTIDATTIEHIEVVKDPVFLAKLGPLAANGVIWITTKAAKSGKKQITLDSYVGVVNNSAITPVNSAYENAFRRPFYQKYGTVEDLFKYPAYLRDSLDLNYYGKADWTDLYYKNAMVHGVSASLTGGTRLANFRFQLNNVRSASGQDASVFDRTGLAFFINMSPLDWLTISSSVIGNRMDRERNRNFRDRILEQRYVPTMLNPLPPSKNVYAAYLRQFDEALDENQSISFQGYFSIAATPMKNLSLQTRLAADYNEGVRNMFMPSPLLEDNNFLSNYFGYNQRFMWFNSAEYTFDLKKAGNLTIEAGQSLRVDAHKYQYAFGYNTENDFVKIKHVSTPNSDKGRFIYYPMLDKMKHVNVAFHGQLHYTYHNLMKFAVGLRRDGSSYVQPDNRWVTTPTLGGELNLRRLFMPRNLYVSTFDLRASYAQIAIDYNTDRFDVGPSYVNSTAWGADPHVGSYIGAATSARPYNQGWVSYGLGWQTGHKFNSGIDFGLWENRFMISLDFYKNVNSNMLLPVEPAKEYGYKYVYQSGLAVSNTGLDVSLKSRILDDLDRISWTTALNLNLNRNKIESLPGNRKEIIIQDHILKVGTPVDAIWAYENVGIYNTEADIPVNGAGKKLTVNGLELNPGDAKWVDQNGDFDINVKDKIVAGTVSPKLFGGWINELSYKKMALSFHFYFALGGKLVNSDVARRLDFINNEGAADPYVAKEVTFWQKTFEPADYPLYNPWSNALPYRIDQTLFVQDASFLKLRSLTMSYDLTSKNGLFSKKYFEKSLIYISATNLFTLSKHKGVDPELIDYRGYYTGYSQSIPQIYTVGIKLDF